MECANLLSIMEVSNKNKVVTLSHDDNIPLLLEKYNYTTTDLVIDGYKISDHLGKGSYGDVYSAKNVDRHKNKPNIIAIKVIDYSLLKRKCQGNPEDYNKTLELLQRQETNLKACQSNFIIKLYDSFTNEYCKVFLLEHCNKNLRVCLAEYPNQCLKQNQAIFILKQICLGVYAMYQNNIVHRDLKPENVALVDRLGTWKIIDFGFSKRLNDKDQSVRATMLGSPNFMAPEVLQDQQSGTAADIYSIGMIFLKMVVGNFSYDQRGRNIDFHKCRNSQKEPLCANIVDLLQRMLVIDPKERINWKQLLNHPIFKGMAVSESVIEALADEELERIKEIQNSCVKISYFEEQQEKEQSEAHFNSNRCLVQKSKESYIENDSSKTQSLHDNIFKKKQPKTRFQNFTQFYKIQPKKQINKSHIVPMLSFGKQFLLQPNQQESKHLNSNHKAQQAKSVIVDRSQSFQFQAPRVKKVDHQVGVLFRQAKLAQYVLNNIIEPIQNIKNHIISASSESDLKLMILLCQRVFIDIWFAYIYCSDNNMRQKKQYFRHSLKKASRKNAFYRQLHEQLQRTVPKVVGRIPKAILQSMFNSQKAYIQYAILHGQEGKHFIREEQINLTVEYVQKKLPKVNNQMLASWMRAYKELLQIECKEEKVDDYVFVIMNKY